MATADEILNRIRKSQALTRPQTLITSTTINYINDSTTSLIAETSHNQVEDISLCSSFGLASLPASQKSRELQFTGGSELPPTWRGVKWDLYKNPDKNGKTTLKLKMSVIKQDRKTQALTASLNSPHDRLWRGIQDQTTEHWKIVREIYQDYRAVLGAKTTDWRVSKFYLDSKKASVDIMAVFLHWNETNYCIRLVYEGIIYDFDIAKDSYQQLNERQLKTNQVATAFFGQSQVKMVNPKDLGL